jgi:hypothetical protein
MNYEFVLAVDAVVSGIVGLVQLSCTVDLTSVPWLRVDAADGRWVPGVCVVGGSRSAWRWGTLTCACASLRETR